MNIIPGEPVPPGFEDEVRTEPQIQPAIDQYKGNALLGLEYTIELHEDDREEPGYLCVLCDKRGDPRTIMQHWTSFNHRMKYLEKHFTAAVREFNPVKYKPNSHTLMITIVQKLAEAIEDHHGRLALSVCNADEFRRMKSKITNEINAKFHYDERNGPNFVHIIDRSLFDSNGSSAPNKMEQTLQITLKAPKRTSDDPNSANPPAVRDSLDEISSDSDSRETPKKQKKREQSPAFRILPRVRRSPPFEEERQKETEKKLPTPKELSIQASHIAQERYKWEKYRCMLEIQLKQMEKIQLDYEKNPEKHPLYPEEWKKFWNRRYKELQAEKKLDPNKYDYKPEWIIFWTKRMKDLFNTEVEQKKKEIKQKLGLPEDAEEKVDQLKEKYKVQVSRNATGMNSAHGISTKIAERIQHSPAKNHSRERDRSSRERNRSRDRVRDREKSDVIDISDDDSPRRNRRSRTRSRSRSPASRSRRDYKRQHLRSRSISLSPEDFDRVSSHHSRHRSSHAHGIPPPPRAYAHQMEAEYYAATAAYSRLRYPGLSSHYPPQPTGHYRVMDSSLYPKYERSPSPSSKPASNKEEPEPEDDGPLTVVAVLRLLTALEDHLGSLGPKVVDLLGKALALEKVKANSADEMLTNDDHCVFFETIKEKLKGLLIADVLEDALKVRAVKKAIKNIAAIVHQVSSKGTNADKQDDNSSTANDGELARKRKFQQKPNVKDLPFDRQIVATKLAAALVMQECEDVSTEDMDKLIFMFVLMVKLSKEKMEVDGKSLHTKDILPELGIYVPQTTPTLVSSLAALPAIVDELLVKEVNTFEQEVEEEISTETVEKEAKNDSNSSMLESLTDSDLQTLLQNFKHLSSEEQHHLITHLKKLETADPIRVEKLRKFVNMADVPEKASTSAAAATTSRAIESSEKETAASSRSKRYDDSPPPGEHGRKGRSNYNSDDELDQRRTATVSNPNKFCLDDEDDDDYNFDDVFKAASSNVNRQSEESNSHSSNAASSSAAKEPIVPGTSSPNALTFNPAGLNISLSDTQNLIANLMGSLQQSNSGGKKKIETIGGNTGHKAAPAAVVGSAPKPVPTIGQVPQQPQPPQPNVPYYQQGQQQAAYPGYNQMNNPQAAAYYNAMGGYNNGAVGYPGYQQWGNGQQMQNMQQFGMQNMQPYGMQPPQQQQNQMGGYNMYGGHGGN